MLSGVATVIRIATGLLVTKIVAFVAGPAGVALIGQLQNIVNLLMLFAGDFLKTAITKFTAQYHDDSGKTNEIWSASLFIICSLNILWFIAVFTFSEQIANYFLSDSGYGYLFKIFSISLPFYILNSFLMSVLNGRRLIKQFILLNICTSIISLLLVALFSYFGGMKWTLISYVTNQSIVFFITFYIIRKEQWCVLKNFKSKVKVEALTKLMSFALITFTSILVSNSSLMFIRTHLIETLSDVDAGNWQAMWSLSQVALSLITTSLSTYLLPQLSSNLESNAVKREIYAALRLILPLTIMISAGIYLLKDFIILILYTNAFMAMKVLFLPQLIGCCIKVCGWLFGYVLVAKGLVKLIVISEVIFAISWCVLTILLTPEFGVIGAAYAFVINSLLHTVTMFLIFKFKV
jgi:PST family polysaccharide transporter